MRTIGARRAIAYVLLGLAAMGCGSSSTPVQVRLATFNASLNRDSAGQLARDLSTPDNQQAKNVAEVIQRVRPDVLLINEFDYEENGVAPALFQKNYLSVSQNGAAPIEYPHRVYLPVNTGVPSGFDLDNDGKVVTEPGTRGYGNDCFGFGQFPGQYGFVIYSKFPVDQLIVAMQDFLWKDLPGAMLPKTADGSNWYNDEELATLRLSSKNHVSVPIKIGRRVVRVLASHPTPPAFDGPEDRNGKRNHDEIKLLVYWFGSVGDGCVVMGDLNADPSDGGSVPGAIQQLLNHPDVNSEFVPRSEGAVEAASHDGGNNAVHRTSAQPTPPTSATAEARRETLRVDYVLPSKNLKVLGGGVFWPAASDPLHRLVQMKPTVATSDHRLVYIDVQIP